MISSLHNVLIKICTKWCYDIIMTSLMPWWQMVTWCVTQMMTEWQVSWKHLKWCTTSTKVEMWRGRGCSEILSKLREKVLSSVQSFTMRFRWVFHEISLWNVNFAPIFLNTIVVSIFVLFYEQYWNIWMLFSKNFNLKDVKIKIFNWFIGITETLQQYGTHVLSRRTTHSYQRHHDGNDVINSPSSHWSVTLTRVICHITDMSNRCRNWLTL